MQLFDKEITPEEQQEAWYVGRQNILDDIALLLRDTSQKLSKVVILYGPGGIGKTAIRKMTKRSLLIPGQVPYVVIDFEPDSSPRTPERTFSYIRRELGRFGLKFPLFDIIWARHWEVTTQQQISKSNIPPQLDELADVISAIPIFGNFPQAMIGVARLSEFALGWILEKFGKLGLSRLQNLNALELLHLMPEALGRDLEEMSKEIQFRGFDETYRITIIFDGFEHLASNNIDDWFIREFFRASGSTLKVIFGREVPQWGNKWKEYQEIFPIIQGLESFEANEYLKRRDINDPDLRKYLVEISDGFPYYLSLVADSCQVIKELIHREPIIKDFSDSIDHDDLGDKLLAVLLRQLSHDELDAAMLAAIPRWFNQEILELLLSEPASSIRLFSRLIWFSFCDPLPATNGYIMRKEARIFLRKKARKLKNWGDWNESIREYHAQQNREKHHLLEEIYHSFIVDPQETLILFRFKFFTALNSWKFDSCWELIQATPSQEELPVEISNWLTFLRITLINESWSAPKERLDSLLPLLSNLLKEDIPIDLRGQVLHQMALIRINSGNREGALAELKRSVSIFGKQKDKWLKASCLRDLGDLYYSLGDFNSALKSMKSALFLLKKLKSINSIKDNQNSLSQIEAGARIANLPISDSLRIVASLYARTGRIELAVKPLENMLEEGINSCNLRIQAEAQSELGLVYRRLGRAEDAKKAYLNSITLFKEIGVLGNEGHAICGLGMAYEILGDIENSQKKFKESLIIFETMKDKYGQAKNFQYLARLFSYNNEFEKAIEYNNRALSLFREIPHIPSIGPLLIDFSGIYAKRRNYKEAMAMCTEALGIFEGLKDTIGKAACFNNIGLINYFIDKKEEALCNFKNSYFIYFEILQKSKKNIEGITNKVPVKRTLTIIDFWVNWLSMYNPNEQAKTLEKLTYIISICKPFSLPAQ